MPNEKITKKDKDKSVIPIFSAVSVSFLLAIIVSIVSLVMLARENTKEIDTMLSYRIYDQISGSLNEPIVVARTMACDDFLDSFLENESAMSEEESIRIMQKYLKELKDGLSYDSAFLVSEKSRRYYTYEGLNKIVDSENDSHDIWYSLFVEKDTAYDLDVDSDEMNHNQWTVFVNARIEDENGDLLGVCGVGVQMTNLQELFLECEKEYGVKINLVDNKGMVQVDTQDINIENAWIITEALGRKETDEYHTETLATGEFVVTKYVEYLGWYLVVQSSPTSISRQFIHVIVLNVSMFLLVMVVLFFMIAAILKRTKKEREDRERLLLVSERALAASEAKSSFLSSMSHEIRTPINTVLGMNEMILRETEDEKILEYSSNINNAGRTLLSLINSILDFSKIEEGKMEIIPIAYDTASMINNLIVSVSERAREKGLEFQTDIDENLPCRMVGDDVRISQVIMNILTNAVKYTKEGFIKLTIKVSSKGEDRIEIYVAVEDSGIGIKEEDLPRLFESFERLDEVKNRSIEGTGLGMAIVSNLLRMMNSRIQVKSEYGKGSIFFFTIQQELEDATPIGDYTKRLDRSRKQKKMVFFTAPAAKVLVVDDNEMNLKVARNLLGLFGISPKLSESGQDAIEEVKKDYYHIILLDHMMPEMDGKETLNKMKEGHCLTKETKVVALTANAIAGARDEYLEAGFHDYLSKPIELSELEKVLRKWLPESFVRERGEAKELTNEKEDLFEFYPEEETGKDKSISVVVSRAEPENNEYDDEVLIKELVPLGLDTEAALGFCGGDEAFYEELLSDFVSGYEGKKKELDGSLMVRDWHEFEVKIHALKSTAKTIGAMELSGMAFELEEAADKLDEDRIRNGYPVFMSEYTQMAEGIGVVLKNKQRQL